jgi:acyl-coenzyme A thioesterase PaaI-like protein
MNNTRQPIEAVAADIPDGYAPHSRKSPLTEPWEPIYSKAVGGSIYLGLRIRQAHCNSRGFAHGGLISALADNAMGLSAIETARQRGLERAAQGLTVSLTIDFLGSAQIGQWLEVAPHVLKTGSSLGFVECLVLGDGQPIARGNATFRVYSPAIRE